MKSSTKLLAAFITATIINHSHAQNEFTAQRQIIQGGVQSAWSRMLSGKGVSIGIIDQGFDLSHEDLLGRVSANKNFYSAGAVTWGVHGTAMASIAAGNRGGIGTMGVAPDAKLLLAQVGPGANSTLINSSAVYRAIDWASNNRADIINMSFGATFESKFVTSVKRNTVTGVYFSPNNYGVNYGATSDVINYYTTATNRGSILVAAAGNQGLGYSEFPGMYATRTDPNGRLLLGGKMVIVGAVDTNNIMASFSNRAGHLCQNAVNLTCLDPYQTREFYVVAPGVNIVSSTPNQLTQGKNLASTMTGTSPAAAYVSGGLALIKQAWPQLRAEQLVALLLNTTRDLGAPGVDNVYGRGLVDFDAATRPQGQLILASRNSVKPSQVLSSTGSSMTAGLTQIFRSTSVLPNAQVLDSYGRNYTANLGQAIIPNRLITYSPDSPWLGFAGYTSAAWKIDQDLNLKVMSANSGAAAQIERVWHNNIVSWQVGSQQESNGFLGNSGSGALGLGSSATIWTQIGYEHAVSDQVSVIAQYGQGTTQVQNSTMSMIEVLGPIQSRSWRLGVNRNHNFQHNDRVGISLASPVSIRSGQARVSGVVGFDYEDDANGNVNLVPIIGSEVVSLRSISKEYNLVLNYQHPLTQTGSVSYNLIQRYNAGGQPGLTDTFVGVNLSWINR